jgi:hypothetical protein
MCNVVTREVNGLVVAIEQKSINAAHAARKLLYLYKIKDERDLRVELRDLSLVEPLSPFLQSAYVDHKQRIVITDEWDLSHFKALAAWLAAPAKEAPAQKAPEPRRRREGHSVHRGREKHAQYVAAHS